MVMTVTVNAGAALQPKIDVSKAKEKLSQVSSPAPLLRERPSVERDFVVLRQVMKNHHIHLTGARVLRYWGIGYSWESAYHDL